MGKETWITGNGGVYPRGRTWWMQWSERVPGKDATRQRHKSTKVRGKPTTTTRNGKQVETLTRKKDAEAVLRDHLREREGELKEEAKRLRQGRPAPNEVTMCRMLQEFEEKELPRFRSDGSRRSYRQSLRVLRAFFREHRDPAVEEVGVALVDDFQTWRLGRRLRSESEGGGVVEAEPGKEPSKMTVNRDHRVLKHAFNFAARREYAERNPAEKVQPLKVDEREAVILEEDTMERLLSELEDRPMARMFALLLAETGLRWDSEALWLQWDNIDFARGFLVVESRKGQRTKSGRSREVPITPRLREALQEHAAAYRLKTYGGNRSPWVFHNPRTGKRRKSFRSAVEGAAKRGEVPEGWRLHDLRHRRVTTWLEEGHPIALVSVWLGHSTVQVTEGYWRRTRAGRPQHPTPGDPRNRGPLDPVEEEAPVAVARG